VVDGDKVPNKDRTKNFMVFEEFIARGSMDHTSYKADPDDIVALMFTGRTTGRPKEVMYTHRGVLLNAQLSAKRIELTENNTGLLLFPLFHAAGYVSMASGAICRSTGIFLDFFDVKDDI